MYVRCGTPAPAPATSLRMGAALRVPVCTLVLASPSATCHHVIMPARHVHVSVQVICPARVELVLSW